jgi:hypothetical protein
VGSWITAALKLVPTTGPLVCAACLTAAAATANSLKAPVPNRKAIAVVYCALSDRHCTKTYGQGPSHYRRGPHGFDHTLDCRWYGYPSPSLGVYKHFCIPPRGAAFAPQGQNASSPAYKPRLLVLAGEGSVIVRHLRWSSWKSNSAHGRGSYGQDDCNPWWSHYPLGTSRIPVRRVGCDPATSRTSSR